MRFRFVLNIVVDTHKLRFSLSHAIQLPVTPFPRFYLVQQVLHIVLNHLKRHVGIGGGFHVALERELRG